MPTKLEANASFMKPRFVFLVLALALIFCMVFVGGVGGATWNVPADGNLADVVLMAGDKDTIVIMENYVISEQVILSSEYDSSKRKYITKTITITNAAGVDVTISSGLGTLSSSDNSIVDTRTLFKVNAGKLIVTGNESGGSLTITSNHQGRAFDVNFDDKSSWFGSDGDGQDATLEIHEGVHIYKCGFVNERIAQSNNGGAVYIRQNGEFIMNGGLLSENKAGGGGAVYVDSNGYFVLNDGLITNNDALYTGSSHSKWGGGVWAKSDKLVTWNGGEIKGNTAMAKSNDGYDYNEIYPYIEPPVKKEISPIYVSVGSTVYDDYWSVKEAYDDMISKNVKTFNIHIRYTISQGYIEEWVNGGYVTTLDEVAIGNGISVTLMPGTESVNLGIIDQMFTVSGGSLTISGNGAASLAISGKNTATSVDTGGFVLVEGGSLTVQSGVTISSAKAKKGGAIYLKSGSCTLSGSSKITGCTASEKGGAVYVADGTFTVKDSALVDASNDVYLEDGEVITVASGYSGTIKNIALSDYEEGRNVVDVTAYSYIDSNKFVLNDEAHDDVEKILVLTKEGNKNYLEIQSQIQFSIIIPEDLELSNSTYDGVMVVTAENVKIPQNAWISVTVKSQNDFNLNLLTDSSIKLPYALTLGGSTTALENNAVIARFTKANSPNSVNMQAKVTAEPRYSGSYADYLTFTVQYGTA